MKKKVMMIHLRMIAIVAVKMMKKIQKLKNHHRKIQAKRKIVLIQVKKVKKALKKKKKQKVRMFLVK